MREVFYPTRKSELQIACGVPWRLRADVDQGNNGSHGDDSDDNDELNANEMKSKGSVYVYSTRVSISYTRSNGRVCDGVVCKMQRWCVMQNVGVSSHNGLLVAYTKASRVVEVERLTCCLLDCLLVSTQ
jgi:hypothetical protein